MHTYDYRHPTQLRRKELLGRIQELQTYIEVIKEELEHRPEIDEEYRGFRFGGQTFMYRTFAEALDAYHRVHKAAHVNYDEEAAGYRIETFYRRTDDKVQE